MSAILIIAALLHVLLWLTLLQNHRDTCYIRLLKIFNSVLVAVSTESVSHKNSDIFSLEGLISPHPTSRGGWHFQRGSNPHVTWQFEHCCCTHTWVWQEFFYKYAIKLSMMFWHLQYMYSDNIHYTYLTSLTPVHYAAVVHATVVEMFKFIISLLSRPICKYWLNAGIY